MVPRCPAACRGVVHLHALRMDGAIVRNGVWLCQVNNGYRCSCATGPEIIITLLVFGKGFFPGCLIGLLIVDIAL